MTQTIIMVCIGTLCTVSALCWFSESAIAAGMAFLGFGIGYFALAALFAPGG